MDYLFQLAGVIGVILISIGVSKRKELEEDFYFILGGVCLEIYSIYIGDVLFMILQIIFIASALYEYLKIKKSGK